MLKIILLNSSGGAAAPIHATARRMHERMRLRMSLLSSAELSLMCNLLFGNE
jgi:hypothetical protein